MSKSHGALSRFFRSLFNIGGGDAVESDISSSQRNSRSVIIRYRNNRGRVTQREVNVLGIGHGYIDAFDSYRNAIRTFKINRIQWTELTTDTFIIPTFYSPSGWVNTGRGELS